VIVVTILPLIAVIFALIIDARSHST
jgi:hypothetical protein